MIKEAYISFETAKLLKEKGFIDPCFGYYFSDGTLGFIKGLRDRNSASVSTYSAPTQQMAMRWLREEKYILIFILPAKDENGNLVYSGEVWIWNEDEGLYNARNNCGVFHVYEKACEVAIKYCLENLI